MDLSDKFEKYKNELENYRNEKIKEIRFLREEQKNISPKDIKKTFALGNKIDDLIDEILKVENTLNLIRIPSEEDIRERINISENFENDVMDLSPSNYTVIFKGYGNINEVDNIIKNRSKIVIDSYNNLKDAEPGIDSFYPYGAIFAFIINNNIKSNDLDLKNDLYLLTAVITTSENIEKLQSSCDYSGIDKRKIMTHDQFIELLKNKYEKTRKEIILP